MKGLHQHFARQAATVIFALLLAVEAAAQCTRYTVKVPTPLGICGIVSETNSPTNISPQGDLVGEWSCAGGNERAMVAWDAQQIVLLPLQNTYAATAEDMNSKAAIVGTRVVFDLGYRGFHYQNGQLTDLPWLPGHGWCEAFATNDNTVVVGFSSGSEVLACRWVNSTIEAIPLPITPESMARAVNNANQIVGHMGFPSQAFIFDSEVGKALPVPPEATSSNAFAINDNGLGCGAYSKPNPAGGPSLAIPVLWLTDEEMVELGLLPGFIRCVARDLNEGKAVVGYCQNPPQLGNDSSGFVWRGGVMKKLDDLIIPNPNQYRVARAVGINDSGHIAVDMYGLVDAARLDPVLPRPGDTNCDWLVNVTDLLAVINAWGPAPPQVPFEGSPDLNTDGTVNVLDLLAVINDWG